MFARVKVQIPPLDACSLIPHSMFDIVLYQPEIPPNTGNILRLAVNTGCRVHLVRPIGFRLTDRALARAGLDYADIEVATVHGTWEECAAHFAGRRMFAFSTKGSVAHSDARYLPGDALLFGPETRGLPEEVLGAFPESQRLRVPMREGSRSLNLSNTVAVTVYEAWRQQAYAGAVLR